MVDWKWQMENFETAIQNRLANLYVLLYIFKYVLSIFEAIINVLSISTEIIVQKTSQFLVPSA